MKKWIILGQVLNQSAQLSVLTNDIIYICTHVRNAHCKSTKVGYNKNSVGNLTGNCVRCYSNWKQAG